MNSFEHEQYSQKQRNSADQILNESNLLQFLERLGTVSIEGAYKYDLMVNPDIDITVLVNDLSREIYVNLLYELIENGYFYQYSISDRVRFQKEGFPKGYYFELTTNKNIEKWEIDIWFTKAKVLDTKLDEHLINNLSPEQRETILSLKHEVKANNLKLQSVKIYKAVVFNNVTKLSEILESK